MATYYRLEELDEYINTLQKAEAEKNNFFASLWIINVENTYKKYGYSFGYKRKGAKPRRNRPCIIVGNTDNNYELIFFSTSYISKPPSFEFTKCNHSSCNRKFHWSETERSNIFAKFIKETKQSRKFWYLKKEDLDELMTFCGICSDTYTKEFKERLKNYKWKWKKISLK